jgi:hypothetical protein
VFGRDMILPVNVMADWGSIEQQRQKEMACNYRRENSPRISHDYKVGDEVLLKKPGKHLIKVEAPRTEPQGVTSVYTEDSITPPPRIKPSTQFGSYFMPMSGLLTPT